MNIVDELKKKILEGGQTDREEALLLADAPLEELTAAARYPAADKFLNRLYDNERSVRSIYSLRNSVRTFR